MVDGVKPYALPTGIAGLLDGGQLESTYAAGLSRAGVPAGLLQIGLNQARAQREDAIENLLRENRETQDRTATLNKSLIDADKMKQLLGFVEKGAFAENPALPEFLLPALRELAPSLNMGQTGTNFLGQAALDAAKRRALGDQATRFERGGKGLQAAVEGGYRPTGDMLNMDDLLGTPMQRGEPMDITVQKLKEAGQTSRDTKPRVEQVLDDKGNTTGYKVIASTPEMAVIMGERLKQVFPDINVDTARTAPTPNAQSAPQTPAPASQTTPSRPVGRSEQQQSAAERNPGGTKAGAAYGSVSTDPVTADLMRALDEGRVRGTLGSKPAPDQRGWTSTPNGVTRDFIDEQGRRVRLTVLPPVRPGDQPRITRRVVSSGVQE